MKEPNIGQCVACGNTLLVGFYGWLCCAANGRVGLIKLLIPNKKHNWRQFGTLSSDAVRVLFAPSSLHVRVQPKPTRTRCEEGTKEKRRIP